MDKGSVAPPSGLGVVGLDAHSTVLTEQFEQIISRHIGREFDADEGQRRERAAMVDNDWEQVVARLSGQYCARAFLSFMFFSVPFLIFLSVKNHKTDKSWRSSQFRMSTLNSA